MTTVRLRRNADARQYVERRESFRNRTSTLYAHWLDNLDDIDPYYVVYSYGHHFPIYVWSEAEKRWYGNSDEYSLTTLHHKRCAHPSNVDVWLEAPDMIALIQNRPSARIKQVLQRLSEATADPSFG